MSKCNTCAREKCFHRSSTVVGCSQFVQKQKTNADRIRNMSDEELVAFIGHNSLCDQIQNNEINWCESQGVCNNCLVEWLKQTAEE